MNKEIYCTACKEWTDLKIVDVDDYMCCKCNLIIVAIRDKKNGAIKGETK